MPWNFALTRTQHPAHRTHFIVGYFRFACVSRAAVANQSELAHGLQRVQTVGHLLAGDVHHHTILHNTRLALTHAAVEDKEAGARHLQ